MRIISGSARGCKLGSFNIDGVRPTPDRVREALFSMLLSRVGHFSGLRVLDLFSGSGAMGLEALSRGAEHAVMIDQDRQAEQLIKSNLSHCKLDNRATCIRRPVAAALASLAGKDSFDLVFLDPPYSRGLVGTSLESLVKGSLLRKNAIVSAESDQKDEQAAPPEGLECIDSRRFGRTRIDLFQMSVPA